MILKEVLLAAAVAGLPPTPSETPLKDEIVITGVGDPVAKECADAEAPMQKRLNLTVLKVVVTKSRKWGTIWRADRAFPHNATEKAIVFRSVCWSTKGGYALLDAPVEMFDPKASVQLLK